MLLHLHLFPSICFAEPSLKEIHQKSTTAMQMSLWPYLLIYGSEMLVYLPTIFSSVILSHISQQYCPTVFLKGTSNCLAWLAALASSRSSVVRRAEAELGLVGLKPRAAETKLGLRSEIFTRDWISLTLPTWKLPLADDSWEGGPATWVTL